MIFDKLFLNKNLKKIVPEAEGCLKTEKHLKFSFNINRIIIYILLRIIL